MQVKTLDSLAASGVLKDKRVLIRSDLNVPRNDEGAITNDARIVASLPAIKTALLAGAAVMVTSHLGRPKEGVLRPEDSLQVVADRLGELLGREVQMCIRDRSITSSRQRRVQQASASPQGSLATKTWA